MPPGPRPLPRRRRPDRVALVVALSVAASGTAVAACTGTGPGPGAATIPSAADPAVEPTTPAVAAAAAVFRVEVEDCGGGLRRRATGVALAPDLVVTVAHTFDHGLRLELFDDTGRPVPADLVWLDPERDLAVIRLDETTDHWLERGDTDDGSALVVATRAGDHGLELKPARLVRHVTATLDGAGRRAALEVAAAIEPGDSGAPLLDDDGTVVGLVFATARGDSSTGPLVTGSAVTDPTGGGGPAGTTPTGPRGWAVAADELGSALAAAGATPVPLNC